MRGRFFCPWRQCLAVQVFEKFSCRDRLCYAARVFGEFCPSRVFFRTFEKFCSAQGGMFGEGDFAQTFARGGAAVCLSPFGFPAAIGFDTRLGLPAAARECSPQSSLPRIILPAAARSACADAFPHFRGKRGKNGQKAKKERENGRFYYKRVTKGGKFFYKGEI